MQLPTEKTKPRKSLADYTVLVYGETKAGKTSWCAQADGALFLATEPGLNALETYQIPITCWQELLDACTLVAAGNHPFKTIIIDTLDLAYRMCAAHICGKNKIDHESDLGYGKGFALINNEFQRVLTKLAHLPYGLFLVAHSNAIEIETRTGKYTKIVPNLPEKARAVVLGMVDLILFCDQEMVTGADNKPELRRIIRTKPDRGYDAGDRTGRLPAVLPLDYPAFLAAFNRAMDEMSKAPAPPAPTTPPESKTGSAPESPAAPAKTTPSK